MSCASERQVFEPTSQWASEYIERVREGRRAAFALLIFGKNYVGFHCRQKSLSILSLSAGQSAACWWEMRMALSLSRERAGGTLMLDAIPTRGLSRQVPSAPQGAPPFPPCLLFSLAWLTSKQLSTEALWVFPFSSHLLEDEYLLWELHEIVTALQEKRKTSCFCLLKMLYFNCSLPFLSSLPPRLTRSLCIFIMAVTWRKGRIACPHARWYSSSSSSLFILFITCNWSFLRYHYCNYLEEIDEKKIPRQFHATELL